MIRPFCVMLLYQYLFIEKVGRDTVWKSGGRSCEIVPKQLTMLLDR